MLVSLFAFIKVLMHIVNHIGHYPLGAGPSRVDSLISEHEDNPNVDTDELSASIFNAPNVQVSFLLAFYQHLYQNFHHYAYFVRQCFSPSGCFIFHV